MFNHQMRQTWILIVIFIPFIIGPHNHVLLIWINDIDDLFGKKSFSFHIFHTIKVYPSNEKNLDSHNNLHSFVIRHYNHVLLIAIQDIGGFTRKAFSP